jgi:transcriptional regulator with XRE-family HTH domain
MVVGSRLKSLREFKNLSQGHIERRTNRRAISPLNMYILSMKPSFFLRLQRKRV